ncbi:MAG: peptide deformylase [Lentisphaerae bacterium]|nr:peptide deformylase [Lentisphaerota bacterium]
MKYDVLTYGRAELRAKAGPVADFGNGLRGLARDMLDAMYAHEGLGLAAEQVGRSEALCVIDVPPRLDADPRTGERHNPQAAMPIVMVNPRLVASAGEQTGQEGCLSFPGIYANVRRAAEVTVAYRDAEGKERELRARALLARVIQHELDHLEGVLLVDRMSPVQKVAVAGKLKRLRRDAASAG